MLLPVSLPLWHATHLEFLRGESFSYCWEYYSRVCFGLIFLEETVERTVIRVKSILQKTIARSTATLSTGSRSLLRLVSAIRIYWGSDMEVPYGYLGVKNGRLSETTPKLIRVYFNAGHALNQLPALTPELSAGMGGGNWRVWVFEILRIGILVW